MATNPPLSTTSSTSRYTVRPASTADVPLLPAIEKSAGQLFLSVKDLEYHASDEPLGEEVLNQYALNDGLWVAAEIDGNDDVATGPSEGELAGFIATFPLDNGNGADSHRGRFLHVAELSVSSSHQQRGVASQLINHVLATAKTQGFEGLTLTTYRDVGFNAVFYGRKFKFVEIPTIEEIERTVGLGGVMVWKDEMKQWKPEVRDRRCFMVRMLV